MAGLLSGRRRVVESTPLFDAVATQDTVTQLRAAIRRLLAVSDRADARLAAAVRVVLGRDDDHATVGKPPCDWDDPAARESLVDALVRDAHAALGALHGRALSGVLAEAGGLLTLVAGQDVGQGQDGVFRIARKVARDRVISTVDPQARHGHKSRARTFDGYRAHVGIDPDDELITNITVTLANTADRDVVDNLLSEPDAAPTGSAPGDAPTALAPTTRPPMTLAAGWDWRCSATRPTPTVRPWDGSPTPGTTCSPRCRPHATATGTPKTSSASNPTPAQSPVPPSTPWRSPAAPRRRASHLRRPVRAVPAAHGGHQLQQRANDQHPSAHGDAATSQGSPARPRPAAGQQQTAPER